MKALIVTIGIATVLGLGAIYLYARPRAQQVQVAIPPPRQTLQTLPRPAESSTVAQQRVTPQTLATASSPSHQLGTVSIDPPSIVAGSKQPVTITLQNADPDLIKSSVNLLEVAATAKLQSSASLTTTVSTVTWWQTMGYILQLLLCRLFL
jgi:hypothetical protein